MKHIVKGEEPLALIEFKNKGNTPDNAGWKPNWGDFRKPEKPIVHDTLLNEQGYICCYCMQQIERSSSHFEHLKPRSLSTEEEKLAYTNMLASCGRDDGKPENLQEHCGRIRGNKELFVSPLHHDCESRFRFYNDGMIRPVDDMVTAHHLFPSGTNSLFTGPVYTCLGRQIFHVGLSAVSRQCAIHPGRRPMANITVSMVVGIPMARYIIPE